MGAAPRNKDAFRGQSSHIESEEHMPSILPLCAKGFVKGSFWNTSYKNDLYAGYDSVIYVLYVHATFRTTLQMCLKIFNF